MAWNYVKQKTVASPDARRNDKPVKQEKFVKDRNPVKRGGVVAARPQSTHYSAFKLYGYEFGKKCTDYECCD